MMELAPAGGCPAPRSSFRERPKRGRGRVRVSPQPRIGLEQLSSDPKSAERKKIKAKGEDHRERTFVCEMPRQLRHATYRPTRWFQRRSQSAGRSREEKRAYHENNESNHWESRGPSDDVGTVRGNINWPRIDPWLNRRRPGRSALPAINPARWMSTPMFADRYKVKSHPHPPIRTIKNGRFQAMGYRQPN